MYIFCTLPIIWLICGTLGYLLCMKQRSTCVPKIKVVGQMVRLWECWQTHSSDSMTSTADAGGKNIVFRVYIRVHKSIFSIFSLISFSHNWQGSTVRDALRKLPKVKARCMMLRIVQGIPCHLPIPGPILSLSHHIISLSTIDSLYFAASLQLITDV